ncbi:unnamed protein product [Camellia sinensis]
MNSHGRKLVLSTSCPFKVKEDDEVDNLDIKLKMRRKTKHVYSYLPPEVGLKISRSLKDNYDSMGYEMKRRVPFGPDPIEPPPIPIGKDFVPLTWKNFGLKKLVLRGLDLIKSPPAPVEEDSSLASISFGFKRLVPTGPNKKEPPPTPDGEDSFSLALKNVGIKRLVRSGPNEEQSPPAPNREDSYSHT